MAGDNDKDKKGFSGLSDLASEVGGIDEPIKPEPKAEAKPSTPKQPPQPQREAAPSEPVRKTTSSPPPIETVSSAKTGGGSGWKWILGIVGVIVVIWIANNGGQDTNKPSANTPMPTHNNYESQPSRSTLAREIEIGKVQAKQMEAQIRDMDDRLEDYEIRIRSYRESGMVDEHNRLVPVLNSLVGERNDLYEEYSNLVNQINYKVKRYNSEYC